jgi:hypothetical protein
MHSLLLRVSDATATNDAIPRKKVMSHHARIRRALASGVGTGM